jgi:hypothetical protein
MIVCTALQKGICTLSGKPIAVGDRITPIGRRWALYTVVANATPVRTPIVDVRGAVVR